MHAKRRKSMKYLVKFALLFAVIFALVLIVAAPTTIAYDMVGSASQNLTSYTDDPAIPFSSAGDGFNKFQRGVSPSIPFAVVDDSLGSFPPDNLGIIKTGNIDEFFGTVDTNNGDTLGRDVVATWVFDISGASILSLSIDMGAMGDFEAANDFFNWSYSIDGGPAQTAFQSSVDEAGTQDYTMEGGLIVTLSDPMLVNGVLLNKTQTAALAGSGNQLTLILTANTDGGSEAIAFQNIVISGVGGGNAPPTVVSTDPTDGAEYVNVDSNIEIVFSEAVTTTGDWFTITCDSTPVLTDPSGGPTIYTLDPVNDLPSTTECTVTIFADSVADQGDPPLNMEQNYTFSFTTNAVCGDPATFIHDVQGPGFVSPIVGDIVTVEGVVVGDFQEGNELNGFFIQEEFDDFDSDDNTSEGVFIFEGSFAGPDVNEGELVRVTGEVDEFKTLTQLKNIANVLPCDYAPDSYGPIDVTLPEETDGDLEKVEGMNINVTNTMSVAQNFFLGRYGQLTLSSDLTNRLFQPTNQVLPNTPDSAALADYNARNLLFLDDGMDVSRCGDNPVPVPYLGPAPPAVLRGGDHVSNLTGVLDYGQINSAACSDSSTLAGRDYRLQPTQEPLFSTQNPRTTARDDVGGSVKVVSFNVLNFFNGDGKGGGFPTSRGADTYDEFVRQRIKIFEAMKAIDGDVVGLMEIENDGFGPYSAIAELVKVMNEGPCYDTTMCVDMGYDGTGLGAGTYAYINAGPGAVGTDAITVGFIYKPSSVTPIGSPLVVDDPAFTDPNNTGSQRNRPAIAQAFSDDNGGDLFTPIVNHLKSKGSPCGPGDDDPEQASCNGTRALAAQYLVDTVIPAVQAASGDPDVMIMGDLNAYAMEDPIQVLIAGGFTNLIKAISGDYAYSYTFDGMVGYLDHSLTNDSLTAQVTGVTVWHINTDEPAVIDYDEDFNPSGYYSPDAYRASDHDPVIVGLNLNRPPICEAASPSVEKLWPVNHKFVAVSILGVTDPDSDPIMITIDAIWQDEPVNDNGDGNTSPDGTGVGTGTASVRAERAGNGNGRVYTIGFTAEDGQGGACSGEVLVSVPKNQGRNGAAVDDGALFDSTVP
jgi:predicted extracellular nuclease